jgi:hypothetical protein
MSKSELQPARQRWRRSSTAVDRLDEIGMLCHLPIKKFEEAQHDRIDVLVLVGGRSFRCGGKDHAGRDASRQIVPRPLNLLIET